MDIQIRNNKGDIILYTKVSKSDYELLSKYNWCKSGKYINGNVNNTTFYLHRYIMIEIMKKDIPKGYVVDHIDNDPYNNTRENLRITSIQQNAENKSKKKNASSIFMGVYKTKYNTFQATILINKKSLRATYKNEIHAAHQYNLWIDEYNITYRKKNIINIPTDFIKWTIKKKNNDLPIGIRKNVTGDKFDVYISIKTINKYIGTFETIEDAIDSRKKAEIEKEKEYEKNKLIIKKEFNQGGLCFFKIKEIEVIVDGELFDDIVKHTWWINNDYVRGNTTSKNVSLSRFIMDYEGDLLVDHINSNKYDNRLCNLRLATHEQNSKNKSSAKGSSSQYVGVHWHSSKNKWETYIKINNKRHFLGNFNNEKDAAKARDNAIKLNYNDGFSKLNFIDDE